ncbi:hypothetical protein T492DRAFT_1088287 [Pavlovales sp. CCMP2436]|nr:hypothetical protein T492DRAFT_1088287 [Pavlovales sp. CCMP2436]
MTLSSFVGRSALSLAPLSLAPRAPPQQAQAPATAQLALLACFTKWFSGSFDNAAQAADDAAGGLAPREGGGHEHIRCHVQNLEAPAQVGPAFLADYRFPARGDASFRTRLYTVRCDPDDAPDSIRMEIFRPSDAKLAALVVADFDAAALDWTDADFAPAQYVPDCDVRWRFVAAGGSDFGEAHFDGELVGGDVQLFSPMSKAMITVTDSLQLFDGALWINDRGYDAQGAQIYGNWRGVPYKLALGRR